MSSCCCCCLGVSPQHLCGPCVLVPPPHPNILSSSLCCHPHNPTPNQNPTQGKPENLKLAQEALLKRAKANSDAQLGQYNPANESAEAGERTYEKGYKVSVCVCVCVRAAGVCCGGGGVYAEGLGWDGGC